MWYLLYALIVSVFKIGLHAGQHDEPKNEKYNFWAALLIVAFSWVMLWITGALKALVAIGW